jgi:Rrf2 family transcriptional regulator, cysteine metabolism repressor
MKLSTRGDYATRALLELALVEGQALSVHELAERTRISPKYLEQIMMRLRTANILRSHRGANGGYRLARSASDISIGEVVRLMDGPLAPSPCASESAHVPCPAYRCPTETGCVLRGLWADVRDAIADVLDRTTFGELAERQRGARRVEAYAI